MTSEIRMFFLTLLTVLSVGCVVTAHLLEPGQVSDADLSTDRVDADVDELDDPRDEEPEGPPPALGCGEIDDHTVALYTFEEGSFTDILDHLSSHHGLFVGSNFNYLDGPPGCGQAIRWGPQVEGVADTYSVIEDSDDWDIVEGSIRPLGPLLSRPTSRERNRESYPAMRRIERRQDISRSTADVLRIWWSSASSVMVIPSTYARALSSSIAGIALA